LVLVNENGYWKDAEAALRSIVKMPFIDQKVPAEFRRASRLTINGGTWRSSRHEIEIAVPAQMRPACRLWNAREFAAGRSPASGGKSRTMVRQVPLRGDLSRLLIANCSLIDPALDNRMKVDDIS
jgi:hypothetical protein